MILTMCVIQGARRGGPVMLRNKWQRKSAMKCRRVEATNVVNITWMVAQEKNIAFCWTLQVRVDFGPREGV